MRLIDADALLEHQVEADRMGAMLVVGKGFIMEAPTITPQPDPITGLVPCGCGGKAEIVKTYDENSWTNIVHVACKKCKIHITFTAPAELRGTDALKEDAKAAWNRDMGYKEQ